MLLTIILLAVIPIIDVFFVVFFMKRWLNKRFNQEKQQIIERLKQFTTSPDEQTPSELQDYIMAYSPTIANSLYKSLIASFNQTKGAIQRNYNNQEAEAIESNLPPIAGLLMNLLPNKMKKSVLNNPGLIQAGASLFSKQGAGGSATPGNGNGHSDQVTNFNKFGG